VRFNRCCGVPHICASLSALASQASTRSIIAPISHPRSLPGCIGAAAWLPAARRATAGRMALLLGGGLGSAPRTQPCRAPRTRRAAPAQQPPRAAPQLRVAAFACRLARRRRRQCRAAAAQQPSAEQPSSLPPAASLPAAPPSLPPAAPPPLWVVPWDGGLTTTVTARFLFLWCGFGVLAPGLLQALAGSPLPPRLRAPLALGLSLAECAAVWQLVRAQRTAAVQVVSTDCAA
jgi:hypothetical protein